MSLPHADEPEVSMLRVAVLSDALRDRNGVDTYYRDLVSHLRGQVAVATLLNPDAANGDRTEFFAMPLPGDRTQKVYFPHPRRLYKRLREIDPHVVITATPGPFGLAGVLAARWRGAGLVAGFHTHLERLADLYWNSFIGGINSRYLSLSNRVQFRFAQHAVVNSLDMITEARRLGATRVELIGTPLPERFLNMPVAPFRARLRHVLYAGRLSREKNLDSVMEAAARLPDIHFSVAGAGPLGPRIAARAAELDNLHHMGWIPRERLLSALDDADLLVLPSQIEAFGTVALEAMARGRLALVSPHCGILQWPGLDACIFQIRPDEHLADAIERIARLPTETRARTAQSGLRQARALHADAVQQWLRLLYQVHLSTRAAGLRAAPAA
ncbi:MAG: glycosyltransferase [Gammaproteobacteria bacterium]